MVVETERTLRQLFTERILLLDGAMGTMIQSLKLDEKDFRGKRFADHPRPLKGCNDLLCLTQPGALARIYREYLEAGADIIETNSFNANAISLSAYGLEGEVYDLNLAAAQIARRAADLVSRKSPERPRFVAGAIGPTNRTASLSPDVNNPAYRAVTFDQLVAAYYDQVRGLIDGPPSMLPRSVSFSPICPTAALLRIEKIFEERG